MNLTKLAEEYIEGHPFVKECLKKGLINYSALARQIIEENKLKEKDHLDAVLVAIRRYFEKTKSIPQNEKRLQMLLKNAKLEIRNKIGVTILDKRANFEKLLVITSAISKTSEIFHLVQGTSTIAIIAPQEFNEQFSVAFRNYLIDQKSDLAEIAIKTSNEVETTIGWEAFLSGLLAENGISFYECIGCWEDNIYIIHPKDLPKAMNVLKI